jgi:hypothetical protein
MANHESKEKGPEKQGEMISVRELKLVAHPNAIAIKHFGAPPPHQNRRRIHPRRVLPRVRQGRERQLLSPTHPVNFHLQRATAGLRTTSDDLTLLTNVELTQPATQQLASSVGEPSCATANQGQLLMYTGNWYAAFSADGGQTFQYVDPFTAFSDPPNLGYCCDQVVNYIPSLDTFVWLLQYGPKAGPESDNIQRLAFAKSADVVAGHWKLFDITTANLGLGGQFLDFPDLAVGSNFLYVTTNVFTPAGQSAGAAVVRIPLDSIDAGAATAQSFVSSDLNSFRVAQNCADVAFFATHVDTSTIRLFSWKESDAQPSSTDLGVATWAGGQGYQSQTPDGNRWLDRVDPRMTGACLAGTELWFAWSVDAGSNQRPNAFVQIAHIDANNKTLIENVDVFDTQSAIAYGALSSNTEGEVGISYMIGGQRQFPSHMVGILTGTRKDMLVAAGDRGPLDGQWGDFLTVRSVFPDQKLFAATGYTMKGNGDGSNRDVTPRYVVFGRSSDVVAVGPVAPGTTPPKPPQVPGPLPPSTSGTGDPITDVRNLPLVSSDVAAQIKAACGLVPGAGPRAATYGPVALEADKPGVERWPVKTGQDPDRAKVGKNVVNSEDLGIGIVPATIEELISLPRPAGMENASADPPQFQSKRGNLTETTIWQIECKIIAVKHEADGDYHLVLQGASGAEMVGEIPTPTNAFVGDSPWLDNIKLARQQIDDKFVRHLAPQAFALMGGKYVPHGALTYQPQATAPSGLQFVTPQTGSRVQPLFSTAISPTSVRLTGVGFFDRAHGATGAAPNVIELHPIQQVEFL